MSPGHRTVAAVPFDMAQLLFLMENPNSCCFSRIFCVKGRNVLLLKGEEVNNFCGCLRIDGLSDRSYAFQNSVVSQEYFLCVENL